MRNPYSDIDPLLLLTALLCQPKRKRPPPTPAEIERARQNKERGDWNAQVAARKAAKKGKNK